jgi:hypothetical protein
VLVDLADSALAIVDPKDERRIRGPEICFRCPTGIHRKKAGQDSPTRELTGRSSPILTC